MMDDYFQKEARARQRAAKNARLLKWALVGVLAFTAYSLFDAWYKDYRFDDLCLTVGGYPVTRGRVCVKPGGLIVIQPSQAANGGDAVQTL